MILKVQEEIKKSNIKVEKQQAKETNKMPIKPEPIIPLEIQKSIRSEQESHPTNDEPKLVFQESVSIVRARISYYLINIWVASLQNEDVEPAMPFPTLSYAESFNRYYTLIFSRALEMPQLGRADSAFSNFSCGEEAFGMGYVPIGLRQPSAIFGGSFSAPTGNDETKKEEVCHQKPENHITTPRTSAFHELGKINKPPLSK